MPDRKLEEEVDPSKSSSARPEGWPGIPGRSLEHEREPDTRKPGEPPAEVTEEQRDLERKMRE